MPPQQPTDRRFLAVLVTGGYLACVIAVWAFISLATDRDAIEEKDAGYILGPAMVVATGVVVAIALWRLPRAQSVLGPAVGTAASAYLVMLVVGTVGYVFIAGQPLEFVLFPARHALNPFTISAGALAGLSVLFLWLVTVRDRRSPNPPPTHDDI